MGEVGGGGGGGDGTLDSATLPSFTPPSPANINHSPGFAENIKKYYFKKITKQNKT